MWIISIEPYKRSMAITLPLVYFTVRCGLASRVPHSGKVLLTYDVLASRCGVSDGNSIFAARPDTKI